MFAWNRQACPRTPVPSIGAQDSNLLLAGFQIGILQGAKSVQLRPSFIKQNGNFEKSQDLKGRSEKFKNQ
jgi:hypothetical protein